MTGNISNIEQKLTQYNVEGLPGICIIGDIINYSLPQNKAKHTEIIYIVKGIEITHWKNVNYYMNKVMDP